MAEKKNKIKTSDKIITAILILGIISFGVWFGYNKFLVGIDACQFNKAAEEKTEAGHVMDWDIEWEENNSDEENMYLEYRNVVAKVDEVDGSFVEMFRPTYDENNYSEVSYELYSIPEEEFTDLVTLIKPGGMNYRGVTRHVFKKLNGLFNADYESVDVRDHRSGKESLFWYKYMADKGTDGDDEQQILCHKKFEDTYFDGDMDSYFLDNELDLKCEDCEFLQVGLVNEEEYGSIPDFYLVGHMYLTTESAVKGFEGNELIPPVGETRKIKIRAVENAFNYTGGLQIANYYIELSEME